MDSSSIADISKCCNLLGLFSPCIPPAFPPGIILEVDGEERGADSLRGGQRHLPQANISATGLLLPLQRRAYCHQEEEVSLTERRQSRVNDAGVSVASVCRLGA